MLRPLPPETFWTVTCIGRHHQRMLGLALLMGAPGIRTGLEDVAYIAQGRAGALERGAGRDGGRPRRHARPRGRDPGAGEGAADTLAEVASTPVEPPLDGRSSARRGPETREAIDEAAIELFARRGYHATSMRALASAARVQPAAIYHWYPNKEAILVGLQDDFMDQLTERVVAAIERQDRPALRLAAAVREHVVFHGVHRLAAFVTDSRDPGADRRPARGADRPARRLPGDLQRADPRRDPRRLAALLRRPGRHLRDPAPVHRRRAVVRPRAAR